jgi:hypothetical protein
LKRPNDWPLSMKSATLSGLRHDINANVSRGDR